MSRKNRRWYCPSQRLFSSSYPQRRRRKRPRIPLNEGSEVCKGRSVVGAERRLSSRYKSK
ncbi:hypothetical protein RvY_02746 [Ramazzottius varieornatus]|uniref:Uncharacterized protein n=1 Tax=Ramazzottius varieornatus TaxID=947166 RepID=A0A1D1ULJ6_RAMVA|nr:hypothetical protein RvY_02746 [Ramazzottius varieornatus]